jgi:UDP-2,3-diacylglucosamine hydrolase
MMKTKAYFFSDVHLGLQTREQEAAKENIMLALLDEIKSDGKLLVMNGDIFDYWFEYKHAVPKGHYRFLAKLRELVESGTEVLFNAGNHDFFLGKYFDEELGVKTHYGAIERNINGKQFYIVHGDGVGKGDTGYKLFRSLIRNNFNIKIFRWLHPDIGLGIMDYLSKISRKHTYDPKDEGENERLIVFANELASSMPKLDYFICGHRHIVKLYPLKNGYGYYVNTGMWIGSKPTYAVFDGDKMLIKNAKTNDVVFAEGQTAKVESPV